MTRPRYPNAPRGPRRRSPIAEAVEAAATQRLSVDLPPFPTTPQPGGPDGHVVLTFAAPSPPLSVNRTNGRSHHAYDADQRAWEAAAAEATRAAFDQVVGFRGHRVRLTFALPVKNVTQADSGNYVSGPTVKGAQDGIARTNLLVPDDTATWVETQCVFWSGGPDRDEVRVKVEVAPLLEQPGMW